MMAEVGKSGKRGARVLSTKKHESAIEHRVDRAGWGPGPWDQEPDRVGR